MSAHLFQHYLVASTLPVHAEGGQPSRTHLALDLTSLDPVCLRLGPDPGPRIMDFLEAFHHRREADLASSPQPFSGGVHEEASFLVERWVVGAPLGALRGLAARNPLAATHLAWSLTRALADLHGQYLVHGDLHPGNVLLDRRGALWLVGEFPAPLQAPDTSLANDVEARRYAAPEVDAGGAPSRRADVFALGLLLYEIFEGRCLLAKHAKGGIPLAPTVQAKIDRAIEDGNRLPPRMRQVIFQSLRLVEDHRPSDAGEVLDRLIQAGEHIPTTKARRTTLEPLARQAMRGVAPRWLPEPVTVLEPDALLGHAARIWQYAQCVSRRDRAGLSRGYVAVVEALWLALAALGRAPGETTRAQVGVAMFWLHRAVHRWPSRTLTFLVEAIAHRVLAEDNPLRLAMTTRSAITPEVRESLRGRCREQLMENPLSNRALITLAILDEDLPVTPGADLASSKARALARAGLIREALMHHVEGGMGADDAGPGPSSSSEDIAARLPELLEALGQARALSHPAPIPEDSEPPLPRDQADEELTLDSGVLSDIDLDDESAYEVDLDTGGDTLPVERPSSAPGLRTHPSSAPGRATTSAPIPDTVFSLAEEHAAALFSRGQTLLAEDRLEEATEVFHELVGAGLLQRAHYRAALTSELRRLLWRVVHPRAPKATQVLVELWELCLNLRLDDLASQCELLLLRRRLDAPVEAMVGRRPRSPHLLEACIHSATLQQNRTSLCRYQVELAQLHLDCGELAGALEVLQRVPVDDRTPEHATAWARMFQVAEQVAQAATEYRRLLGELSETEYVDYAAQRLGAFLDEFPFFGPARQHLIEVGLEHQLPRRTGVEGVIQAEIFLLRQRPEQARRLLRRILELETENDEAMLLLAALAPDLEEAPLDRALLRPHILTRAGAVPAAYHQAMRGLSGGPGDVPLRELLIELCQRLGRNPAPHRLALGLAALETGDPERARSHCTMALGESEDPSALVAQLLEHPRIGEIFTDPELRRLANPAETVEDVLR